MSRARYLRQRNPSKFGRLFDYMLAAAILGLLLLLAARLDGRAERSNTGQATVHDGDTLTVQGQRVRLRGIDAPEYNQSCRRGGETYACGRMALSALAKLAAGRPVTCRGWERDKYDRLLGRCSAGTPPLDLNGEMVRQGWAVSFGDYHADEALARQARLGVWQGDFQRPRDWRLEHEAGRQPEAEHESGSERKAATDRLGRLIDWLRQLIWA